MKRLVALLILLWAVAAMAQTTTILPSGGIGLSCNAVTAATSISPGLAGGCASLALVTSGGNLPVVYTWQVITTGSPGSIVVNFMGSLDGTTWTQLDTTTSATTKSVIGSAYRFLGCVPATLSGGSSPTVTCQVSVSAGTAGGSITTVSGTASQVAVANGSTTPTISLDSTVLNALDAYATDTGSANTVVIAIPSWYPAVATLGSCVNFKAAASATGATTLNATPSGGSAYGPIALMKRVTSTAVAALGASGDMIIGGMYEACYDGTQWVLMTTSSTVYTGGALTAGQMLRGNSNNQAQGSAGIIASAGNVFTTYGGAGLTTSGMGVPPIYGAISQASQTAAVSTATLCTAALCGNGTASMYHVHWDFWGSGTACSNVTAGSVTFLLTWTDENAVTHAAVALQMMGQTGAATVAMGSTFPFQTALANESASGDFTFSTNGTIIQYATGYTACTTGTGTYNLRAVVTRLV